MSVNFSLENELKSCTLIALILLLSLSIDDVVTTIIMNVGDESLWCKQKKLSEICELN